MVKYKSCDWVLNGLEFSFDELNACCFDYLQGEDWNYKKFTNYIQNYSGENIDYKKLFEEKHKMASANKKENFAKGCKDCIYLEEKEWDDKNGEDFIDHLIFNHWVDCNSNCIYCHRRTLKNIKSYDILPIIKDMDAKGYLRATKYKSCITFGGGEVTELKNFEELLFFLLEKGFDNIRINSSGIKYSKAIGAGLKQGAISIVISPDSGTEAMYKKIKRVPKFYNVWKNLKKYAENAKQKNQVKAKYILIPRVNSDKKEIDAFFKQVLENNIKAIAISIEANWFLKHKNSRSERICNLLNYMQEKAAKYNLDVEMYCEVIKYLQQ